jgi:hypothetical protein
MRIVMINVTGVNSYYYIQTINEHKYKEYDLPYNSNFCYKRDKKGVDDCREHHHPENKLFPYLNFYII